MSAAELEAVAAVTALVRAGKLPPGADLVAVARRIARGLEVR